MNANEPHPSMSVYAVGTGRGSGAPSLVRARDAYVAQEAGVIVQSTPKTSDGASHLRAQVCRDCILAVRQRAKNRLGDAELLVLAGQLVHTEREWSPGTVNNFVLRNGRIVGWPLFRDYRCNGVHRVAVNNPVDNNPLSDGRTVIR
jgi:hypothetical protein